MKISGNFEFSVLGVGANIECEMDGIPHILTSE